MSNARNVIPLPEAIRREALGYSDDQTVAAEYSEIALADEFVARHRGLVVFVPEWETWMVWDGRCWVSDDKKLTTWDMAKALVSEKSETLEKNQKTSAAKAMAMKRTVAAVRMLAAKCYDVMKATADQWDSDPWQLNTPAGVICLKTGETLPHDRNYFCTKITAASPASTVPPGCLFLRFIDRICGGDQALIDFMQRALGYSLTGVTVEEAFFFLFGSGQNGKTKLQTAVSGLLGSYHESAAMETFVASRNERHPADLAKLRSARFVTASETEEGRRWAESKLKAITGGDVITARFMRGNFFEFRPQLKLWIAGNHKPGLRNVDKAMRRRLNLIPFTVTIPEAERDRDLEEKLKAEWPFILRWMIDGCLAWQEKGLAPPPVVTAATDEYMAAEDVVRHWLEDCCVVDGSARDSFAALWSSWKDWAERAGEQVGTQKRFGGVLQDRGFVSQHTRTGRVYAGLKVIGGGS